MAETKSRVFIVNKAGHDFSGAEKYGELVAVTSGNINVFRPDRSLFQISEALKDFDPDSDYLLLTGHVFTNVLAFSVIMFDKEFDRKKDKLEILVYDAKNQVYLNHTLRLNSKGELVFQRKKKQ